MSWIKMDLISPMLIAKLTSILQSEFTGFIDDEKTKNKILYKAEFILEYELSKLGYPKTLIRDQIKKLLSDKGIWIDGVMLKK